MTNILNRKTLTIAYVDFIITLIRMDSLESIDIMYDMEIGTSVRKPITRHGCSGAMSLMSLLRQRT